MLPAPRRHQPPLPRALAHCGRALGQAGRPWGGPREGQGFQLDQPAQAWPFARSLAPSLSPGLPVCAWGPQNPPGSARLALCPPGAQAGLRRSEFLSFSAPPAPSPDPKEPRPGAEAGQTCPDRLRPVRGARVHPAKYSHFPHPQRVIFQTWRLRWAWGQRSGPRDPGGALEPHRRAHPERSQRRRAGGPGPL